MRISLSSVSTLCADEDLHVVVDALRVQLASVATAYDREAPEVYWTRTPLADKVQPDVAIFVFDDADQAGALGYHAEDSNGNPYARVFARDSIAGLANLAPASLVGVQPSAVTWDYVAPVISHEAVESFGDVHANDWADDGGQTSYAYELCDPVEASLYTIVVDGEDVVTVSDFVCPAWFDPSAPPGSTFDYLGVLSAPLTIASGGYAIRLEGGTISQVFGERIDAWRKASAEASADDGTNLRYDSARLASRTGKRFAHHAMEVPVSDTPSITPKAAPGPSSAPEPTPAPTTATTSTTAAPVPAPASSLAAATGTEGGDQGAKVAAMDTTTSTWVDKGTPMMSTPVIDGSRTDFDAVMDTIRAADADEVPEATPHPEPRPVGAVITQDNVSEPGTQITKSHDAEGAVVEQVHETQAR